MKSRRVSIEELGLQHVEIIPSDVPIDKLFTNKGKKDRLSGGSANYYKLVCVNDEGVEYVVECKDIIRAKNLNYNQGNILKPIFRMGSKEGTTDQYDLEKQMFFALEELRRLGYVKDNKEAVILFEKLLGQPLSSYL